MLKKLSVGICIAGAICLFWGCGGNTVRNDLQKYIYTDLTALAVYENDAILAYGVVSGDNYTDDEFLYAMLKDNVIPNYRKLVSGLEAISLETKEIRALNEKYIDAANTQYNAFLLMQDGIENENRTSIIDATERIDRARRALREWQIELADLRKKYMIDISRPAKNTSMQELPANGQFEGNWLWRRENDDDFALLVFHGDTVKIYDCGELEGEAKFEYTNEKLKIEGINGSDEFRCVVSGSQMVWITDYETMIFKKLEL